MTKKKTESKIEEFSAYYDKFKALVIEHLKYGYGRNPPIPVKFSEGLCVHLFKLTPSQDRKYDASKADGKKIEIKATGANNGTTTIQKDFSFDELYWLMFDFEKDELTVTIIPKNKLSTKVISNSTNSRITVTLSQYTKSCKIHKYSLKLGARFLSILYN